MRRSSAGASAARVRWWGELERRGSGEKGLEGRQRGACGEGELQRHETRGQAGGWARLLRSVAAQAQRLPGPDSLPAGGAAGAEEFSRQWRVQAGQKRSARAQQGLSVGSAWAQRGLSVALSVGSAEGTRSSSGSGSDFMTTAGSTGGCCSRMDSSSAPARVGWVGWGGWGGGWGGEGTPQELDAGLGLHHVGLRAPRYTLQRRRQRRLLRHYVSAQQIEQQKHCSALLVTGCS